MAWLEAYPMHSTPQASGNRQMGIRVPIRAVCMSVIGVLTLCVVCSEHLLLTAWLYAGIITSLLGD